MAARGFFQRCGFLDGIPFAASRIEIFSYLEQFGDVVGLHVQFLKDNCRKYAGMGFGQFRNAEELRGCKRGCVYRVQERVMYCVDTDVEFVIPILDCVSPAQRASRAPRVCTGDKEERKRYFEDASDHWGLSAFAMRDVVM